MERFWLIRKCFLRIFKTLFSVTIVNAYLGFQWESIRQGVTINDIAFEDFAGRLAYQMINNRFFEETNRVSTRSNSPFV